MNHQKAIMSVRKSTVDALDHLASGAIRVGRGTAAGFIAGMISAYVMDQYQEIESRPVNVRDEEKRKIQRGEPVEKPAANELEADPKVMVAERVSRKFFDHELSPLEKKAAAPAVHYGYRAVAGAVYGGLSELIPTVGVGLGIPYATLLWLGGDEIALPALGLSKLPTEKPAASHASALATHFVFGISLDITRRILRRII